MTTLTETTVTGRNLEDKTVFSVYGISIEHPKRWKICFDPKRAFQFESGFVRIEDFIPRKGAQISLSVNWEKADGDNESFARMYSENISAQYQKQMKKSPYQIEANEIIDFLDGKAVYIVSEYRASPGLVRKKSDGSVRTIQLAFYDEASGRAVVSSVIGFPDKVTEIEEYLHELIFSVKCHSDEC